MFPTVKDYEMGIVDAGEPHFPNAGAYLLWIRDTFIQDTPFTYRDIEEVHLELQQLRPVRYGYLWSSLRNILREWIWDGLLVVLDGHEDHIGEHTLMWTSYYRKRMAPIPDEPSTVIDTLSKALEKLDF